MFETLTQKKKLERAKKLFMDAMSKDTYWQKEAREDFKFRDGDQWSDEEKQILEEELRPILTFNLTKSSVDLIMGMNEDNKVNHRASPFEPSDAFLCEVLNDLSDYFKESNDFDAEQDGALESSAICGRGWVGIDFAPDPRKFGEIQINMVDVPVHEVHFDPAARRPNLEDASYIAWDRWMTQEDFKIRFPKYGQKKIENMLEQASRYGITSDPLSDDGIPVSDHESVDYEREMDSDINYFDRNQKMIRLIHMEYWEAYQRYYVFNPESGSFEEVPAKPSKEQEAEFEAMFGEPITVEIMWDKRVKWLQFVGDEILYDDLSPLPYRGFSLVPVFTYRDASKRTANHFGLVRLMKDPQREINKRWSQALNMLNQQVQPGVYAETDAFVDERQATQSMKVAGDITWVNAGALTGGKIKERTVPSFPTAPMQMEQFSQDIMKKITGINPDLLGQDRGRQEPGVVIRLRQQQGITLLKPLFKNFNTMKKELFKRLLAIIMKFMPDGQMMRVLGQNDAYQINPQDGEIVDTRSAQEDPETGEITYSLTGNIRDVRMIEYNVVAEQSPGNMTKRMLEMQSLMEMMDKGLPVPPEQIIEKMEISASEKQRWIDYIQSSQQQQAEMQDEQMQTQVELETRKLDQVDKQREMDFIVDMTKIEQMSEKDKKSMQTKFALMSQQEKQDLLQFSQEMLQIAAQVDAEEAKAEGAVQAVRLDGEKARQDIKYSGQKATQDLAIDRQKSRQNLAQDKSKYQQDMKFTQLKNAIALNAAKKKAEQDIKIQRQKAKEGGNDGKGKPTSDA
jgi:hypothetical protein